MSSKSVFSVKIVAIISFLFMVTSAFSQKESVVYIGTNGKLTTLENALFMQKISTKSPKACSVEFLMLKDSKWEKIGTEHYKKVNDSTWQIKASGENSKGVSRRTFAKQADGTYQFRDLDGENVTRGSYAKSIIPLLFDGTVTEYYLGGKKKSVSKYENNELVSNENWNADGTKYIDDVFYSVENYPFFNPGNPALHAHIKKGFQNAGIDFSSISGSMKIGFVVMEDGTIDGIKIVKGLGPVINGVAVDSFKTLKGAWTPAKLDYQTVRYFQEFPINFISNEGRIDFAEMRGGILHFQTY